MTQVFRLLKSNPAFFRVLLALFVSGIGTAFTSVAVYQNVASRGFGPFAFGLVFAAGLLPGLFTSIIAGRFAHRWNIRRVLLVCQTAGMVSLVVPLIGSYSGNVFFLIAAEVMASAVGGFLLPMYKGIERASFSEESFQYLAVLDSWILSANFIFGQGLGSLMASQISLRGFLAIDALSYVVALLLIYSLRTEIRLAPSHTNGASAKIYSKPTLTTKQRRALAILPWIALVCAPPMVLLPSRAVEWNNLPHPGFLGLTVAPVLLLICARTVGQILGPLVAAQVDLAAMVEKRWVMPLSLSVFLGLYAGAYHLPNIIGVAVAVVIAHIASNFVFSFGSLQLLKNFESTEMVWASGWIYRCVTLVTGTSGLAIGLVANSLGHWAVLAFSAVALVVGAWWIFVIPDSRRCLEVEGI